MKKLLNKFIFLVKIILYDEKAAGVLYAAVDAFNAEGLSGDANETAKLLQKLYPQSKQAKNVKVQE